MSSSRRSPTSAGARSAPTTPACPVCGAHVLLGANGRPLAKCEAGHEWWAPNPGPQTRFLASKADEILYGGAAGGGKSAAIIAMPLRWVNHRQFRALILRRETTQLGDLLDKAGDLYARVAPGAKFDAQKKTWTFPSGAKIRFNHCEHEKDAAIYDGHEFQLVEPDELTHFTERQYRALRARIRSSHPDLPRYTRSTTNPGGGGHDWVFKRWGPWLDPSYKLPGRAPRHAENGDPLPPADPGEVLYFVTGDQGEDVWVPKGTLDREGQPAQSRSFIPARLADNPKLLENDPGYAAKLRDLDPVRSAQLKDGNWLIKPSRGLYFNRAHIAHRFVDAAPVDVRVRVRYWDRAASVDGDWTVGVKLALGHDHVSWVEDAVRFRGDPGLVESTIVATAATDGLGVIQCLEQDPGQAGVQEMRYLLKALRGFRAIACAKRANKIVAAGPFSAQWIAGNVRIVRGQWNEPFLAVLAGFPEDKHDDDVDAASGAYSTALRLDRGDDEDQGIVVGGSSRR